ncbi:MAG: hypothetical protein LBN26_02130 [Christensenellaceae bacterium]|nr:hypothetical protein [Christensenellaceae bacterium]
MKQHTRLFALLLCALLVLSVPALSLAEDYTAENYSASPAAASANYSSYGTAKQAKSLDKTIYLRKAPDSSSDKANIVKKLKGVKGKTFELLGETGDWYFARYGEAEGFVRKQDFAIFDPNAPEQAAAQTAAAAPSEDTSSPSGDKWGSIKVAGTVINHSIMSNRLNSSGGYKYDETYYNLFALTPYSSQVSVIMGHNMRKSAGSSRGMFHQLHHVQNAFLGKSTCESCGKSCSGAKTSVFNVNYQGYSKWQLVCFYETPASGAYRILENNVYGAGSPSSWLQSQYSNARTSGYKGKVVDDSATASDHLMILITCGDKYGSSSTSRLYVVLKAIG